MRCFENQTLFDIAIQACGDVQAAYDIALLNGLNITDDIAGFDLIIPEVVNKQIVAYYSKTGIKPATGLSVYAYSDINITGDGIFDESFDESFN